MDDDPGLANTLRIGISGYDYPEWRGDFYPSTLPRRAWLAHAIRMFATIEINGTFYSLKTPATFERWREAAAGSDGFVYALKGSSFITHKLRLKGIDAALANFYASGVLSLGRHTGPFLWQLPESLPLDPQVMHRFLELLPRDSTEAEALARRHDDRLRHGACVESPEGVHYRHALEVRHPSFASPEFLDALRERDVALVVADSGEQFPRYDVTTASFTYVRLHGPRELYSSEYGARELEAWRARIEGWRRRGDVYVYFDNTASGAAPRNALALETLLRP